MPFAEKFFCLLRLLLFAFFMKRYAVAGFAPSRHMPAATAGCSGIPRIIDDRSYVGRGPWRTRHPDRRPSPGHLPTGGANRLRMSKGPMDALANFFESTAASVADYVLMQPKVDVGPGLRRVRTQFIAALGDPEASSGTGAEEWGIWRVDPGPRGVLLPQFSSIERGGGKAPSGWTFDPEEFWIEEYGRVMEKPSFPIPPGNYLVTGGRRVQTVLTIDPPDARGRRTWKLEGGAKLYDVTHLPCRAAKYVPKKDAAGGTPAAARLTDFPVKPGASMPAIEGCSKRDYAVLFVLAVEDV